MEKHAARFSFSFWFWICLHQVIYALFLLPNSKDIRTEARTSFKNEIQKGIFLPLSKAV